LALKRSVIQLMSDEKLTVSDLADKSGLCEKTVRRAVQSNEQARLNTTSATVIAETFGLPVGEINWPGGLENRGRPALTGGTYTRRSD